MDVVRSNRAPSCLLQSPKEDEKDNVNLKRERR